MVDSYPPRKSEEELILEMQGLSDDPAAKASAGGILALTPQRSDFVSCYLPPFDPRYTKRKQAVELCQKFQHLAGTVVVSLMPL